ncbi:hypothetical protein ACVWXU_008462 [Streptomyces sp. TE33382]
MESVTGSCTAASPTWTGYGASSPSSSGSRWGSYDRIVGLALDRIAVDGCITKAPGGGSVSPT